MSREKESTVTGEHKGAMEFLRKQAPRGRRNSLSQADGIHRAPLLAPLAPTAPPVALTRKQLEKLRHAKTGAIDVRALTAMLDPSTEKPWDPDKGGGRRQIRTGRNFEVPDAENQGQFFRIRIHTNDNTRSGKENAARFAVARIEHVVTPNHSRFLMGGKSHSTVTDDDAWVRNASDAEANAAHIPLKFPQI